MTRHPCPHDSGATTMTWTTQHGKTCRQSLSRHALGKLVQRWRMVKVKTTSWDSSSLWQVLLLDTVTNTWKYEEHVVNNQGTLKILQMNIITSNMNIIIWQKVVQPKLDQPNQFHCACNGKGPFHLTVQKGTHNTVPVDGHSGLPPKLRVHLFMVSCHFQRSVN